MKRVLDIIAIILLISVLAWIINVFASIINP